MSVAVCSSFLFIHMEGKQARLRKESNALFFCPPGDAIKLKLNNLNKKKVTPLSNHLKIIAGALILLVV